QVASAIEDHLLNALLLRALRNQLADFFRRSQVAAGLLLAFFVLTTSSCGGNHGYTFAIVDQLHVHVVQRAIDVQARTLVAPLQLLANAGVDPPPRLVF